MIQLQVMIVAAVVAVNDRLCEVRKAVIILNQAGAITQRLLTTMVEKISSHPMVAEILPWFEIILESKLQIKGKN